MGLALGSGETWGLGERDLRPQGVRHTVHKIVQNGLIRCVGSAKSANGSGQWPMPLGPVATSPVVVVRNLHCLFAETVDGKLATTVKAEEDMVHLTHCGNDSPVCHIFTCRKQ